MAASRWTLLFSFKARTRRSTWWLATLLLMVVFTVCYVFIDTAIGHGATLLLYPFCFWIGGALAVKRLHDFGCSAWSLLWLLLPILGPIWILARLACNRGTAGENQYGADPQAVHLEYLQVDIQR
jgi:uncharacterized membrane protein YhaH (DUF805 family)